MLLRLARAIKETNSNLERKKKTRNIKYTLTATEEKIRDDKSHQLWRTGHL